MGRKGRDTGNRRWIADTRARILGLWLDKTVYRKEHRVVWTASQYGVNEISRLTLIAKSRVSRFLNSDDNDIARRTKDGKWTYKGQSRAHDRAQDIPHREIIVYVKGGIKRYTE